MSGLSETKLTNQFTYTSTVETYEATVQTSRSAVIRGNAASDAPLQPPSQITHRWVDHPLALSLAMLAWSPVAGLLLVACCSLVGLWVVGCCLKAAPELVFLFFVFFFNFYFIFKERKEKKRKNLKKQKEKGKKYIYIF